MIVGKRRLWKSSSLLPSRHCFFSGMKISGPSDSNPIPIDSRGEKFLSHGTFFFLCGLSFCCIVPKIPTAYNMCALYRLWSAVYTSVQSHITWKSFMCKERIPRPQHASAVDTESSCFTHSAICRLCSGCTSWWDSLLYNVLKNFMCTASIYLFWPANIDKTLSLVLPVFLRLAYIYIYIRIRCCNT